MRSQRTPQRSQVSQSTSDASNGAVQLQPGNKTVERHGRAHMHTLLLRPPCTPTSRDSIIACTSVLSTSRFPEKSLSAHDDDGTGGASTVGATGTSTSLSTCCTTIFLTVGTCGNPKVQRRESVPPCQPQPKSAAQTLPHASLATSLRVDLLEATQQSTSCVRINTETLLTACQRRLPVAALPPRDHSRNGGLLLHRRTD